MAEDKIPETETTAPSTSGDDLLRLVAEPALTEDFALAILKRPDLQADVIEQLAKNVNALKSRKVRIALASHPRTPRHVSVPLARQFYTFDLMKVALGAAVPADVKVAVDDLLISRLKTVTAGERLTLARRASGRVAAALLLDVEDSAAELVTRDVSGHETADRRTRIVEPVGLENRVMVAALENPRLTELLVINSVLRPAAGAALIHAVAQHAKWSCRREIRIALLRTEHLTLARALEFGREIPTCLLHELLDGSRLPAKIKEQLLRQREAHSSPNEPRNRS